MTRSVLSILYVMLLSLLCVSCATPKPGSDYYADNGNMYSYLDESLSKRIIVTETYTEITNSGDRQAIVIVQNASSTPITTKYRFQWFDQSGIPIVQKTTWRHTDITGHDTIPLTDVTADPEALTYKVIFTSNTSSIR